MDTHTEEMAVYTQWSAIGEEGGGGGKQGLKIIIIIFVCFVWIFFSFVVVVVFLGWVYLVALVLSLRHRLC